MNASTKNLAAVLLALLTITSNIPGIADKLPHASFVIAHHVLTTWSHQLSA